MTMKENEHRSIERVSAYASFVESFFEQQDDDERKSMQSYQDVIENHWEIYFFWQSHQVKQRISEIWTAQR